MVVAACCLVVCKLEITHKFEKFLPVVRWINNHIVFLEIVIPRFGHYIFLTSTVGALPGGLLEPHPRSFPNHIVLLPKPKPQVGALIHQLTTLIMCMNMYEKV